MSQDSHAELETRRFRRQLKRFERMTSRQISDCCSGVTLPQCHALTEIHARGRTTTKELATALELDPSTLSRTIDGLVRKGLVERRAAESDRRVVPLALSARGEAAARDIDTRSDAYYRCRLERIPESRRLEVLEAFDELVRALASDDAESVRELCCGED